jgi:formylglycine-generating enzyme required for sulfatase activity
MSLDFSDIFGAKARQERDGLNQKLNQQFLVHQKLLMEHKRVCEELAIIKANPVPPLLLQQQDIVGNGLRYLELMVARLKCPSDNLLRYALLEYDFQRFLADDRASGRNEVNPDARPLILVLDMDLDFLTLSLITVGPGQVARPDFTLTVCKNTVCTVGAALFEEKIGRWVQGRFVDVHPSIKKFSIDNGVHDRFRPIAERLFALLCLGAPHGEIEETVIFDSVPFRALLQLHTSELALLFRPLLGPDGKLNQSIRKFLYHSDKPVTSLDRIVCLGMFCRLPMLREVLIETFGCPVLSSERLPTLTIVDCPISTALQLPSIRSNMSTVVNVMSDPEREKNVMLPTHYTCPITGMEFVLVRGGTFQMGDIFGDGNSDEQPVHDVTVNDFYIGKYSVTQTEWQKIMGNNPSCFQKGKRYPVEQVSWLDTHEFVRRFNLQIDKNYRLPSEAEWEYAARSGGNNEKYSGGDTIAVFAWYGVNSRVRIHPVGQKRANGMGLYDMSGNVWEWVWDWACGYSYGPQMNPRGPSSGTTRIVRGGSWYSDEKSVRTTNRAANKPDECSNVIGFRLAFSVQ